MGHWAIGPLGHGRASSSQLFDGCAQSPPERPARRSHKRYWKKESTEQCHRTWSPFDGMSHGRDGGLNDGSTLV